LLSVQQPVNECSNNQGLDEHLQDTLRAAQEALHQPGSEPAVVLAPDFSTCLLETLNFETRVDSKTSFINSRAKNKHIALLDRALIEKKYVWQERFGQRADRFSSRPSMDQSSGHRMHLCDTRS
jgi:hypothetical protein